MSDPTQAAAPSIDGAQLRALLKGYFRMSIRGKASQALGRRASPKPRGLIFLVAMYAFMGLMIGPLAFRHPDLFTYTLIIHAMTFFVVGISITTESGDILFNVAEGDVLGHRPIHPRTLLLAKSLNLLAFALLLALAANLFPLFFGLAAAGVWPWFPVVHLISTVLLCIFCAASVVFVYALIIRVVGREKFDSFAAWSQIGMSVLFIGGYQVLPRLMDRFEKMDLRGAAPYLVPLPPAWFAGLDSILAGRGSPRAAAMLAIVGLAVTAALAYAAVGRLAKGYAEGLAKLAETAARPPRRAKSVKVDRGAMNPILRWWLRDPIERAAFRLAAAYMRRDRETKLRLYPSLSIFIILPLFALVEGDMRSSGHLPLLTFWMMGILPLIVTESLRMSSQHAAAEIFVVSPVAGVGQIFHGVRKAAILCVMLPLLVVCGGLSVGLAPSPGQAFLRALPALIALPTLSLGSALSGAYLPFSRPVVRGGPMSRNAVLMILAMISMGGLLGLAQLAWRSGVYGYFLAVEAVVLLVIHRVFTRIISRQPMPQLS